MNDNETKLEKLTKYIAENAQLSEKLEESETLRRRFQERHTQQESQIQQLIEQNRNLDGMVINLKNQMRNLNAAKSSSHKVYEEKINTLIKENEKLMTEIQQFKKKPKKKETTIPVDDDGDDVIMQSVEAKPYLFGPVDNQRTK